MIQAGLLAQNFRFRLLEFGLIGVLLNLEEQLAFFHPIAILEEDLFQVALHPGPKLHGVGGLGVAGKFQVIGDRLPHRPTHRDLGGRRRGVDVPVAAGRDGQKHGEQYPAIFPSLKDAGLSAVMANSGRVRPAHHFWRVSRALRRIFSEQSGTGLFPTRKSGKAWWGGRLARRVIKISLVAQASRLCGRRLKPAAQVDAAEGGGATFSSVAKSKASYLDNLSRHQSGASIF